MKNQEIILKPSSFYSSPGELLRSAMINNEDKIKALMNWRQSIIHLQDSEQEGLIKKKKKKIKETEIEDINKALSSIMEERND